MQISEFGQQDFEHSYDLKEKSRKELLDKNCLVVLKPTTLYSENYNSDFNESINMVLTNLMVTM